MSKTVKVGAPCPICGVPFKEECLVIHLPYAINRIVKGKKEVAELESAVEKFCAWFDLLDAEEGARLRAKYATENAPHVAPEGQR